MNMLQDEVNAAGPLKEILDPTTKKKKSGPFSPKKSLFSIEKK